jgi:hypothetical protein
MTVVEIAAGIVIVAAVFYDLFQSVVLPRPAIGKLYLAQALIIRLWIAYRWLMTRGSRIDKRENRLAIFGPLSLLLLLAIWAVTLVLGYGLIIDGLREQLRPAPTNFSTSLWVSGSTLLPLAYGEFVPVDVWARLVILAEAATGVGLIALVISLLFALYASFQQREELVVTLDALAGAPPSGLYILETVAERRMPGELEETFDDWRRWAAAVLESHLAYPILFFFRSSHDNEAWVNSFGAVMDAATLVLSTVEDQSDGPAHLMFKVGGHLTEDIAWYFRIRVEPDPLVERTEFAQARERLIKSGYRCRPEPDAWKEFARLRTRYASTVNQLAQNLAIVPAEWIGDRSYLPHRRRRPRR